MNEEEKIEKLYDVLGVAEEPPSEAWGREDLLDFLSSLGDLNFVNSYNQSPLGLACRYGLNDVVEIMISMGAKVDFMGKSHRTMIEAPIHRACCYKQESCLEVLIKAGADVNLLNSIGHSPLAVSFTNCFRSPLPLAQKLIDNGAVLDSDAVEFGIAWSRDVFVSFCSKNRLVIPEKNDSSSIDVSGKNIPPVP